MLGSLIIAGCGNLSPRQEQKINNQDGKIGEIESLANSMKNELGNLKADNEIQNSRIGQMQQGMANFQSNNSGIQILSGPGGLIISFIGLLSITVLALHYRRVAKVQTKTAEILTQTIACHQDQQLENSVFQAAMYTTVEENVLKLMKKHKNIVAISVKKEE